LNAEDQAVKHQMLRSTSIVGGATLASLVIGMVRMKVIAALLGPAGIGLMGMLNALQTMGASIAGMGLDTSAVRQLSAGQDDPERSRIARWGVWTFAWPLAIAGGLVMWLFRYELARLVLGDPAYGPWVGWVAVGVALTVLGIAQLAGVQSFRRLGDLARIRLWSAFAAAVVSIAAVWQWGLAGIVVAVVATPLATALFALWYCRNLPPWQPGRFPAQAVRVEWRTLAALGVTVMITTGIGSLTQASVRSILAQRLGLDAAGFFQASYAISSLNLGIVLGAMVPEYYPRLCAAATRPREVESLLNHQLHVGLVLAAPALIAISVGAPILLTILYTGEFTQAALLLRFQVAADALRVAGWAFGFVLLARNARFAYILLEAVLAAVFLPLVWLLAPRYGIAATGAAYLLGYLCSWAAAIGITAVAHDIRLSWRNFLAIAGLMLLLLALAGISIFSEALALAFGVLAFAAVGFYCLREIVRIGFPMAPAPIMDFITRKLGGKR
jgi:PST family polysaccharide transporter